MISVTYAAAAIIDGFNSPILAMGLVLVGAGLVFLTSRGHAAALIVSSLIAWGVGIVFKILFAIPRLDSALVEVTGYRFPSLHAIVAGAFFSSLCFSAFCWFHSRSTKIATVLTCFTAICIIAWSRVLLHAHLPIDVIVGSILGISISLVIHYIVLRKCYV